MFRNRYSAEEDQEAVFMDVALLLIAFSEYSVWLDLQMEEGSRDVKGEVYTKGVTLLRRYLKKYNIASEAVLKDQREVTNSARLRPFFKRTRRGGNIVQKAFNHGAFLKMMFRWLLARQGMIQDIFPGRAGSLARKIGVAVQEISPKEILSDLQPLRPVSGLYPVHDWITMAALDMGVPVVDED